MDGSVTPIQLRKKELHSDVVASAFQCFLMLHMFIYLFVQFGFFRTCVFCVTIALRTSVYGTFFWLLTMGSVLYVFTSYYGVAPILLDPCFLCVRK